MKPSIMFPKLTNILMDILTFSDSIDWFNNKVIFYLQYAERMVCKINTIFLSTTVNKIETFIILIQYLILCATVLYLITCAIYNTMVLGTDL